MSTWGLNALGRLPMRLWRRWFLWRANRIYAAAPARMQREIDRLHQADRWTATHAEDPQKKLPGIE